MTQATPTSGTPLDYESVPLLYKGEPETGRRTMAKVLWRLVPFMCLLYIFNYLDRVNVSFAKLQMNADLRFSESVYAMGASIFFVGYFVFEVPSNLLLQRVGARFWMARIMISWGLISSAMMFVEGPWSFYTLRLLLGIAEAGFFPGAILYLTWWVPRDQRAKAIALFMTSTALSGVIGGPLAGLLMKIEGLGLRGWQWMFLLEGIPSVLLGVSILFVLDDKPADAKWLTDGERAWLANTLDAERAAMPNASHRLADAFTDVRVWVLCALYGTLMFGFYGINYWTASVVQGVTGGGVTLVGFLSAIPFLAATIAMVVVGRWTDRTGRRKLTVGVSAFAGAVGMALAAVSQQPALAIAALALAAAGIWSALGPFWSLPSRFLAGTAAAAGIGMINSIGNLFGGFVGPNVMGRLKDAYGTYGPGLWICAGVLLLACAVTALLAPLGLRERA